MAVQAPNKVMAWDTGRGGAALHLRGDGVVWSRHRCDGVLVGCTSFHAIDATVDASRRPRTPEQDSASGTASVENTTKARNK